MKNKEIKKPTNNQYQIQKWGKKMLWNNKMVQLYHLTVYLKIVQSLKMGLCRVKTGNLKQVKTGIRTHQSLRSAAKAHPKREVLSNKRLFKKQENSQISSLTSHLK